MSQFDYDLVVIGGGSGGVRAARMSASFGARVAIIEERYWGGTCVNVGCVPKKLYYYASHFHELFDDAAGYGWQLGGSSFDWETLKSNRRTEISRLNGIYENLLGNANVEVIDGHGTITGNNEVTVGDRTLSTANILIATGGWPYIPEFPGSEHAISSNEVFDMPTLPKSAIVVGGGYIAVEFAGILNGLGVDTHLVYRRDILLRHFDQDVREFVTREVAKKGVNLHLENNVTSIEPRDTGFHVSMQDGEPLNVDAILYATGRVSNFTNLGLENIGLEANAKGLLDVDEFYQTSVPGVYALGDVTKGPELTPVALAEGMVLARHLFGGGSDPLEYQYIPTAVFCQPNVGTVGYSEEQAKARFGEVRIFESDFRHLKHTITDNQSRTYMKIVVDVATDKVVGMHMVGDEAGEIMQGLAVAMKAGVTKKLLDSTIGIHPTAAEEFVTMREPTR